MKVIIRKYESRDIADMVKIWNSVLEDGIAFPQEEYLNETSGAEFFHRKAIAALQKMKTVILWVFTYFTLIMWAGAAT